MNKKLNVVVWNEFRHEKVKEKAIANYPDGLHATIKKFLDVNEDMSVTLAALDDECQGLPDELINNTDVLVWWGHIAHEEVSDELVAKIQKRVYEGKMGFVALHSAHHSKPFKQIVGTNGNLSWGRNQKEIMWNLMPQHPIAAGIPDHFLIEEEELYCEPFYIPQPDALVFGAWYEDGFIFRAGACFLRGAGKIFYFQPGHESCRALHNPYVQKVITNAVRWAAPSNIGYDIPEGAPRVVNKAIDEFNN